LTFARSSSSQLERKALLRLELLDKRPSDPCPQVDRMPEKIFACRRIFAKKLTDSSMALERVAAPARRH
jgi:hypothetical protein